MASYAPVSTAADDMTENLVGLAPGTVLPAAKAVSLMQVTAPADLVEGYEFEVVMPHSQHTMTVTVPPGGVEQGQTWTVPLPSEGDAGSNNNARNPVSIPVGHFRDGVYDIFNYGLCHPHWWTACLCSMLAVGQVIRRLQFTWRGTPASTTAASARAFSIIFYITVAHWAVFGMLWVALMSLGLDDKDEVTEEEWEEEWDEAASGAFLVFLTLTDFFKYLYFGLTVWLVYTVRVQVRAKYAIPGSKQNDFCLSFWCPCFVAGQLLRHTTDYDVYPSQLCTNTGLPKSVVQTV